MREIISRKKAKAKGLKRFFTGIPCKKANHISERLVSNKGCIKCTRIAENRRRRGEKIEIIQRECKSDKCTGEVILYKHGAFNGKAVGFKLGDYNHAA